VRPNPCVRVPYVIIQHHYDVAKRAKHFVFLPKFNEFEDIAVLIISAKVWLAHVASSTLHDLASITKKKGG
jgi:hypothetical protein